MGAIATKAVAYAVDKLGCRYSQAKRWDEEYFDCSSLVYRAYKAAGYVFKSGSTSNTEVNDTEFDLLWPLTGRSQIGKTFTSIATLKKQGYEPKTGDIIYLNTISTTRENKITHVVLVENANTIVHASSSQGKVVRSSIDSYNSKVVAVARFREDEPANIKPRAATAKCQTFVNIRDKPEGNILAAATNGHPLVVCGDGEWLPVATMIGAKPVTGYIHGDYVSK